MTCITRTTTLGCTAETAFNYMADATNETQWNPENRWVRRMDDSVLGTGALFKGDYRQIGIIDFYISGYQQPSKLEFKGGGKRMDMAVLFRFEPAGTGTSLNIRVCVQPKGLMKLFSPFMKGMMNKGLDVRIRKLKEVLGDIGR